MTNYHVQWEIHEEADSPSEAARLVWEDIFGREFPADPDEACVFKVVNTETGVTVEVDLSISYKIVRRYQYDRESEVIETGLTLGEARRPCQDPSTEGDGWFDSFTEE